MKRENFVIEMPLLEWTDRTIYSFVNSEVDGKPHRVLLMIEPALEETDIEQFAGGKKKVIEDSLQTVEVLKDQRTGLKGGNPVIEYVIKWRMNGKVEVYRKYVFVLHKNQGFVFYMDFSRKGYPLLNEAMRRLVDGLIPGTFTPPKSQNSYIGRLQ